MVVCCFGLIGLFPTIKLGQIGSLSVIEVGCFMSSTLELTAYTLWFQYMDLT